MLIKRVGKKIRNRIIAGVLIFMTVLTSGTIIYQRHQMNEMHHQLQLKQQIENQQVRGFTESKLNISTIKGEFNRLQDYPILKNYKVTMNHSYIFKKDAPLGFHRKGVLKGSATVVYDIDVRLADAEITEGENGLIYIKLEKPFLNKESVHMQTDTLIIDEDKSEMNMLCRDKEGKEIMQYFMNTFVTSATEKLEEHYKDDYQQKKLDSIAKQEIGRLLDTLGINNYRITVK